MRISALGGHRGSLTNEETVLGRDSPSFHLRLLIHLCMRLADQWHVAVVAICDPFKHIFNSQQPHNPLRMRDVRIREEP